MLNYAQLISTETKAITEFEKILQSLIHGRKTETEALALIKELVLSSDELRSYWNSPLKVLVREIIYSQTDEANWLWLLDQTQLIEEKIEAIERFLETSPSPDGIISLLVEHPLTANQINAICKNYATSMDVQVSMLQKYPKYFSSCVEYLNVSSLTVLVSNYTFLDYSDYLKIIGKPGWEVLAGALYFKVLELRSHEKEVLRDLVIKEKLIDNAFNIWRSGDSSPQLIELGTRSDLFQLDLLDWKRKIELIEWSVKTHNFYFYADKVYFSSWAFAEFQQGKLKIFPEVSEKSKSVLTERYESSIQGIDKVYGYWSSISNSFSASGKKLISQRFSTIKIPSLYFFKDVLPAVAVWKTDHYEIFANEKAPAKVLPNVCEYTGRYFGVEIELCAPVSEQELSDQLADESWSFKPDASIVAALSPGCPYATELVSSKLTASTGVKSLTSVLAQLNAIKAHSNASCGLHVHHDVREYSELSLQYENKIKEALWIVQDLVYSLCAPRRQKSVYCLGFKNKNGTVSDPVIPIWDSFGNQVNHPRPGFFVFSNHKTIEFRMKEGTLAEEEVLSWVGFTQQLTEYALAYATGQENKKQQALIQALAWSEKLKPFSGNVENVLACQKKLSYLC